MNERTLQRLKAWLVTESAFIEEVTAVRMASYTLAETSRARRDGAVLVLVDLRKFIAEIEIEEGLNNEPKESARRSIATAG